MNFFSIRQKTFFVHFLLHKNKLVAFEESLLKQKSLKTQSYPRFAFLYGMINDETTHSQYGCANLSKTWVGTFETSMFKKLMSSRNTHSKLAWATWQDWESRNQIEQKENKSLLRGNQNKLCSNSIFLNIITFKNHVVFCAFNYFMKIVDNQ